jgi:hypothetical protein
MKRAQLAHILRSAAQVVDDPAILVIGSQAILGTFGEDDLPEEAWMSVEADVAFFDDPDATKADRVDGAIGEMSPFHQMNAYYAQGVEISTAILPDGWRDRLVRFDSHSAEPATALCLERHDLVISKLAARREKDYAFGAALLAADLVTLETLLERATLLPDEHGITRAAVIAWLEATGRKSSPTGR